MERRKEYRYEHLAYIFKNKKMEPFLVTVEPKGHRRAQRTRTPMRDRSLTTCFRAA